MNLVISTGPCDTVVPNVVGMEQSSVETAITNAGLVVGTVTQQCSNTIPAGIVMSQSPTGGTFVLWGTTIDIVISSGLCQEGEGTLEGEGTIEYWIVPNIIGFSQSDARNLIESADLVVGMMTQQCSDEIPIDYVINQNPPAGQQIPIGNPVNIMVTSGPCTTLDAWIDGPGYIVKIVGDNLELKVIVVGAHGDVVYQWYFSRAKNLKSPELIVGANTDTFYIEELQLEDSGFYWCQIADDYDVIDTPFVQLHVITGLNLHINYILILGIIITTSLILARKRYQHN